MVDNRILYNANHLGEELHWFQKVFEARLSAHFNKSAFNLHDLPQPVLNHHTSIYLQFVNQFKLGIEERLVLILSLLPHIKPGLIDNLLAKHREGAEKMPELGGINGSNHGGFIPTGETALFLLSGNDLSRRFEMSRLFHPQNILSKKNILKLNPSGNDEPEMSGMLSISKEVLTLLTDGQSYKPSFSSEFPAKPIETGHTWDDLVLSPDTLSQVDELKAWLDHGQTLMEDWGFKRRFSPGYKSLFFGPPGTGKSLTAALIGKTYELDVYRIDLSMTVSKYIGETEKNLSRIFEMAQGRRWILFFDEADALFGKRTQMNSSHDRFANQEVSYLLQRMEEYDGLAILATNLRGNLDDAFARRFQSSIHFPLPGPSERLKLWERGFSAKSKLEKNTDLEYISENYELSGGNIMNVIRYASMMALQQGGNIIRNDMLLEGIRKELVKEGKV